MNSEDGQSLCILKLEFITNGATKVCVISVHVKLYLCVAGTRARPHVDRWWVKMPGPFFNPSPSLVRLLAEGMLHQ